MAETEVFRIQPVVNKCYEHAEYTREQGRYPNERYFTSIPPRYIGEFIRSEYGGAGDGGWQINYFRDLDGIIKGMYPSYEGRTCFREVPCAPSSTQTAGKFKRSNKKTNKKRKYRKSRKSRKSRKNK